MTAIPSKEPSASTPCAEIDLSAVAQQFRAHGIPLSGAMRLEQLSNGHSNLTYLLQAGTVGWVLRRPPPGNVVAGPHDVRREDLRKPTGYVARQLDRWWRRAVNHPLFYYVFDLFKLGVIVQQIHARDRQGLTHDERLISFDSTVRALTEHATERLIVGSV